LGRGGDRLGGREGLKIQRKGKEGPVLKKRGETRELMGRARPGRQILAGRGIELYQGSLDEIYNRGQGLYGPEVFWGKAKGMGPNCKTAVYGGQGGGDRVGKEMCRWKAKRIWANARGSVE